MSRSSRIGVAAGLILAALAPIAIETASGVTAERRSLTFIEPQGGNDGRLVEHGGEDGQPAPGDTLVFRRDLRRGDSASGDGSVAGRCSFVSRTEAQCDIAVVLRRGSLQATGLLRRDGGTLAVIGGTGAFRGASGQLERAPARKGAVGIRIALRR